MRLFAAIRSYVAPAADVHIPPFVQFNQAMRAQWNSMTWLRTTTKNSDRWLNSSRAIVIVICSFRTLTSTLRPYRSLQIGWSPLCVHTRTDICVRYSCRMCVCVCVRVCVYTMCVNCGHTNTHTHTIHCTLSSMYVDHHTLHNYYVAPLIRSAQPPHPNVYSMYIRFVSTRTIIAVLAHEKHTNTHTHT